MEIKSHIDSIKICKLPNEQRIILTGWAIALDDTYFDYQLEVNQQLIELEVVDIQRYDVLRKFSKLTSNIECGFRICAKIDKSIDIHTIKMYFVKKDGSKVLGQKISKSCIQKSISTDQIECAIDAYEIDSQTKKATIRGWAHSLVSQEPIELMIVDQDGNNTKIDLHRISREDLVKFKIVTEEEKYSGFQIEFIKEDHQSYDLVVKSSSTKQTIQLNHIVISKATKLKRLIKAYLHEFTIKNMINAFSYLKKNGIKKFIQRLAKGPNITHMSYHEWFLMHRVTPQELEKQKNTKFEYEPLISIIVPTYNTPIKYLQEMIDSVINQSYANWELCIADGSQGNQKLEKELEKYHQLDARIKYTLLDQNYGIAKNTNAALELANGEYIGLFDHDDLLTPDALFEVVKSLQDIQYDILYTDEDKTNSQHTEYMDPNFKPDYSPDLFRSHNYITHFFVVKSSIIKGVGGFRSEFDGSQDYDVMFRCIEQSKKIYHIPKILYHWRMHSNSTAKNPESKMYCYDAGKRAIEEHYQRVGIKAKVENQKQWGMYHTIYETTGNPLVSIVIPNKDQKEILERCIDSLYQKNKYQHFEIIIVENNSETKEIFEYYEDIQKQHDNIQVVMYEGEFNYSAINNFGVKYTKGDYILLLNNDTEVIVEDALSELLGCCMQENVGIVGAKLLYEDNTVQHGGVVIGFGGFAGHVYTGLHKDECGYMVRSQINCNYSAVTAACMMIKKQCFEEVNGLSEEFKVGLNDIDFCLKVRQLGYLVVYNAHSLWYHYESKSRGYEDTPEKRKRFEGEIALFQSKWKDILIQGDPYYNQNFVIELGPFMLG